MQSEEKHIAPLLTDHASFLKNNRPSMNKIDGNISTCPLNECEKHSFIMEYPFQQGAEQFDRLSDGLLKLSQPEHSHTRGAEQRSKLFKQHLTAELSEQNKNADEVQDEIHSPSLSSNSFIICKPHVPSQEETKRISEQDPLIKTPSLKNNQKTELLFLKRDITEESSSIATSFQQSQQKKKNIPVSGENLFQKCNDVDNISIGTPAQFIPRQLAASELLEQKSSQSESSANQQKGEDKNFQQDGFISQKDQSKRDSFFVLIEQRDGNRKTTEKEEMLNQDCQSNNFTNVGRKQDNLNPATCDQKTITSLNINGQGMRRGSHFLEIPLSNPNIVASSNNNTYVSQNNSQYNRRNSDKSQMSSRTLQKPKKRNFLKAFYFTYKFLQKMRFVRKYKNIYMLEKKHFKLIKDYAFGGLYERAGHRSALLKFMSNIYYLLFDIKSPFITFEPDSALLLLFNFSLLIILTFMVFYIPLRVCLVSIVPFPESEQVEEWTTFVPYILFCEMIISLNTAYFSQGSTVTDRKLIIKRYFSFKFWIDLITLFALSSTNIIPLIFILRINQIFKLLGEFDENFQIQYKYPTVFELSKLIFIIIFVAHVFACGFILILNYQPKTIQTWASQSHLESKDWIELYVASLYFSFTTMITVGFGDIVPYSLLERIYVIVMQLISCGVFAYAINTIGSNLHFINQLFE